MAEPRQLTEQADREMARRIRDRHWEIMEQVGRLGTVWCCWWDKVGRFNKRDIRTGARVDLAPDDVIVFDLFSAMGFLEWTRRHKDWWTIGEWSDAQYAAPVSLTDAGREALRNRDRHDMEPVTGGMVEPGWQCTPAERVPS